MIDMKKFLFIILLLFIASAFKCGGDKTPESVREWQRVPVGGYILNRDVALVSPKGVRYFGKNPLSDAQLLELDNALTDRMATARADGHTQALDYAFYEVFEPWTACTPSPEQRVPSFKIRGGSEYDGSIWDQLNTKGRLSPSEVRNGITYQYKPDGVAVILAAELVVSLGTPTSSFQVGQMIVCKEVIGEGAANGFDHIVLANNPDTYADGYDYFWATVVHGPPHPLLPRPSPFGTNAKESDAPKTFDQNSFVENAANYKLTDGVSVRIVK